MSEHQIKTPPWLTAKVDQRLALMLDVIKDRRAFEDVGFVMTPLTEPPEGAGPLEYERWDHTCDNCGAYSPTTLVTGHVVREHMGAQVMLVFGVCLTCKEANP